MPRIRRTTKTGLYQLAKKMLPRLQQLSEDKVALYLNALGCLGASSSRALVLVKEMRDASDLLNVSGTLVNVNADRIWGKIIFSDGTHVGFSMHLGLFWVVTSTPNHTYAMAAAETINNLCIVRVKEVMKNEKGKDVPEPSDEVYPSPEPPSSEDFLEVQTSRTVTLPSAIFESTARLYSTSSLYSTSPSWHDASSNDASSAATSDSTTDF